MVLTDPACGEEEETSVHLIQNFCAYITIRNSYWEPMLLYPKNWVKWSLQLLWALREHLRGFCDYWSTGPTVMHIAPNWWRSVLVSCGYPPLRKGKGRVRVNELSLVLVMYWGSVVDPAYFWLWRHLVTDVCRWHVWRFMRISTSWLSALRTAALFSFVETSCEKGDCLHWYNDDESRL